MKPTKYKAKNKQSTASGEQFFPSSFIKNIFKGFVFEVLIGILLILILAAVLYRSEDPDSLAVPLSVLSAFVTAFSGGAVISLINKNAPLICGGINAALFIALLFLIPFFVGPYPYASHSQGTGVILKFLIIPISLLGALAASKLSRPKRRRTKKRYSK